MILDGTMRQMDPETGSRDSSSVRETKIPDGIVLSPKSRVPG